MEKIEKINQEKQSDDDLGFLLHGLEEIEHFYPCYLSMIKKE